MKITFVYKGIYYLIDAINIEYLSAIAKNYQYETSLIYDQDLFGVSDNVLSSPRLYKWFYDHKKFTKRIIQENADLIVFFDMVNSNTEWLRETIRELKLLDQNQKTVLLSHINKPSLSDSFDYTLIGEPEFTFEAFLKNEYYRSRDKVYHFQEVANLDALPMPDKGLFEPYVNFKDSYLIFTSRGCHYGCSFCPETVFKYHFGAQYYRRRSPENVIRELKEAKRKYNIQEVIYRDSIFGIDREWLKQFLDEYKKSIDVPYKCYGKAEVFDSELAVMLKESKCYCVEFGVQTFNEPLKRNVLSRTEKTDRLKKVFEICDTHHLMYDADHIFGVPGESVEDHMEAGRIYSTFKYLNRVKCHNLVFYPEAKIHDHAPREIKEDAQYHKYFFSSITGEKHMQMANRCFQKYFKVLPLVPHRLNRYLQKENSWRIFRFIPNIFVGMLMFFLALKNKDKRFVIYFKYYPKKILSSIF